MKKRLMEQIEKLVPGIAPGSKEKEGYVIDRSNFLTIMIGVGVGKITSGVKVKLQHGSKEDGSDMEDYVDDLLVTTTEELTEKDTNTSLVIDVAGTKRYIRVVAETEDTSGAYSVFVLLSDGKYGANY